MSARYRDTIVDEITSDLCTRWALSPGYAEHLQQFVARAPGMPFIGDYTLHGATPVESSIINDVLGKGISMSELRAGLLRRALSR